MNKKSGLTIVEALIVLAILLLLAAISLPALFQNQQKKRAAECAMNLDAVMIACKRQATENGVFPKNLSELVPAYFESVPTCPSGGTYTLGTPEGDPPTCSVPGHHL
jgi:type II secretory pathway pseudopilin PulG